MACGESILKRFLGGADPSIWCLEREHGGSKVGEEEKGTDGASKGSVFTDLAELLQEVAFPRVNDLKIGNQLISWTLKEIKFCLNSSSSSLRFSRAQRFSSSSRSRARSEACSRIINASLIKFRFADPWISARLLNIRQWLRSAWFSAWRRGTSDEVDAIGACCSSGEWGSMYNRRMLGVTNGRKLGGTTFKFTGATK